MLALVDIGAAIRSLDLSRNAIDESASTWVILPTSCTLTHTRLYLGYPPLLLHTHTHTPLPGLNIARARSLCVSLRALSHALCVRQVPRGILQGEGG